MALVSLLFQQKTTIGIMELDVSLSESHEATAQLTHTEVEDGSTISDHIILDPLRVTIEGVISETPISLIGTVATAAAGLVSKKISNGLAAGLATAGIASLGGLVSSAIGPDGPKSRKSQDVYSYLIELRDKRAPMKVVTGLRSYDNMVLTSVTAPRDASTGRVARFTAVFEQVRIVTPQFAKIDQSKITGPIAPSAATAKSLGKQAATAPNAATATNASWLIQGSNFLKGFLGGAH